MALAALVASVSTACGSDDGSGAANEGPSGESVSLFMVDKNGKLVAVETPVDGADQMRPQGRALAAVKLLISTTTGKGDDYTSHWGGKCAAGAQVESLGEEGSIISVQVNGPGGVMCSRSGDELTQQRQQLAWTVIHNMQADPATPVRLKGPNRGLMWEDVTASDAILAK